MEFGRIFSVKNDFVQPIYFGYQRLWVGYSKVFMVILENSLKKLELHPRDSFEDEFSITCVIKEGT